LHTEKTRLPTTRAGGMFADREHIGSRRLSNRRGTGKRIKDQLGNLLFCRNAAIGEKCETIGVHSEGRGNAESAVTRAGTTEEEKDGYHHAKTILLGTTGGTRIKISTLW